MKKTIFVFTAALFSLAWACSAPAPASLTNLPAALVAAPYSAVIAPSGSWSLAGGVMPAGLDLVSNRIAGTPEKAGIFEFVAAEQSSTGTAQSTSSAFKICVAPAPLTIDLSGFITNAALTKPYSYQFVITGGTAPYTFAVASGALPPGLTLSASGLLSGTPTASGQFTFTVSATDSTTFSCTAPIAGVSSPAQTATVAVRM